MRGPISTDALLQAWLTAKADRRAAAYAALIGAPPESGTTEEARLSLAELSRKVNRCAQWLTRLDVQGRCGEWIGGRRSYRLSVALAYLASDDCRRRIRQLHAERVRREGGRMLKEVER